MPPKQLCSLPFPLTSADAMVSRVVWLAYVVEADGSVDKVEVLNRAANPDWSGKLVAWMSQCKHEPATQGNAKVAMQMSQLFRIQKAHSAAAAPALDEAANFSKPTIKRCETPAPVASLLARQKHLSGTVVARCTVHTNGHIGDIELVNPEASPILFDSVEAWLAGCEMNPSLRDGKEPVAAQLVVPFNFTQAD